MLTAPAPGRPPVTGYAGAAEAWAADAGLVYAPLARHLIERWLELSGTGPGESVPSGTAASNSTLRRRAETALGTDSPGMWGITALDVGTGTGVAAEILRQAGARVVGVDLELDMVRFAARSGSALVADATRLPFHSGVFDLTVAAFLVNHLPDPLAGLRELRRVTRPTGSVLCSVFSTDRATAKNLVDEVAREHGYQPPAWYRQLHHYADRIGSADVLRDMCRRAGFSTVTVCTRRVDVGLDDPALVVRSRLGMAQFRSFIDGLPNPERRALIAEAALAIRDTGERFAPEVIEVVARP